MKINTYLTKVNFNTLEGKVNKYIVIHFTANNGDTALGNCKYFYDVNRNASAHYFIDENSVYQCVNDNDVAWHCGAKGYKHPYCRNNNSIGVEMCSRKNANYYFMDKTVDNAVELVIELMAKHNVPIENVIRHYDVTGKVCPEPYVRDVKAWQEFKERLADDMTEAEVKKIATQVANDMVYKYVTSKQEAVYDTIDEVPEWGKATVKKLIQKGVLQGSNTGLDMSYSLLRLLVINDRAGLYD
ncbi:MAG: peptidoglycan recognition family protein [Clostridia bacterium]|nr:peptidoglycan recognition family protein [Clostridia bacterium]